MSIRIIDLSVPFDNDSKEPVPPVIEYQKHEDTIAHAAQAFGLEPSDWPDGGGAWAVELVHATTHTGTHVDAPYHYWHTTGDKPARTIDELPLEWFYGNGVILNFTWKKRGEEISVQDVKDELKRISHELSPGEIVLVRTDCDKQLYHPEYGNLHPGMSAEATRYLISCGIKVMGTDGYGWDVPFHVMAEKYRDTGDKSVIWAAHYVGKELEYCQIEKLANLDQIPKPAGFKVATFPIKIKGASAGWARPVAIIED